MYGPLNCLQGQLVDFSTFFSMLFIAGEKIVNQNVRTPPVSLIKVD